MTDLTRREAIAAGAGGVAWLMAGAGAAARWTGNDSVEKRRLGRTNLQVSVVGFGGLSIAFADTPPERVSKMLNQALDSGLNFIDTAECYGAEGKGHAEDLIGRAVGRRRDEYVLSSKVGHENGAFAQGHYDWSRDSILRTIDRSLKRLRTDHIDIIHLHSCGLDVLRDGEATEALREAKKQGKIRFLACSGDGPRVLYAAESGDFDCIQFSLNVFDHDAIDKVLPAAKKNDVGVVIKRPIGNAMWRFEELPDYGYFQEYWRRMNELEYPFFQGDAKSDRGPDGAGGMSLRWTLATPGVHSAIVGTTRPGRWSQNNTNAGSPMSRERWQEIRDQWLKVSDGRWRREY